MTTPFSICIEPFKNLSTEVRNGKPTVSPCCTYPLTAVDIVDFVNDPTLVSVRQQWLNGVVPDGCSKYNKIKHFKYQAISTPVTVGFPADAAIEFLDYLDQRRNTNWRKTFPLAADQLTKLNSAK